MLIYKKIKQLHMKTNIQGQVKNAMFLFIKYSNSSKIPKTIKAGELIQAPSKISIIESIIETLVEPIIYKC